MSEPGSFGRRGAVYFALFLAYLTLMLGAAFSNPRAMAGTYVPTPFAYSATIREVRQVWGGGDPGSYATGAISLREHGWAGLKEIGFLQLWPFGFPLIQASVLWLFGMDAWIIFWLAILTCLVWAAAFTVTAAVARRSVPAPVAFAAPLVLLGFTLLRRTFLNDFLLFGEPLSTGFWALAVGTICLASLKRSRALAILGGFSLGWAAYVRTSMSFTGTVLTLVTVGWLAIVLWKNKPRSGSALRQLLREKQMGALVVAMLVYQAMALPYMAYNWRLQGSFGWPPAIYYWAEQWMSQDRLLKLGAGWVVEGGGGTGCRVDPDQCKEIERSELATPNPFSGSTPNNISFPDFKSRAMKAFAAHPVRWIAIKAALLPRYWFSVAGSAANAGPPEYVENAILLLALLGGLVATGWQLSRGRWDPVHALLIALTVTTAATFTIVHIEARYLYPLKLGALQCALLILVQMMGSRLRSS